MLALPSAGPHFGPPSQVLRMTLYFYLGPDNAENTRRRRSARLRMSKVQHGASIILAIRVHLYVCMYVCMHACMHACMYMYICIYVRAYTHLDETQHAPMDMRICHIKLYSCTCLYTYMHVIYTCGTAMYVLFSRICMYMYVCTDTCRCVYVYIYTYMHVCTCVCAWVCMYTCTYGNAFLCICISLCLYICIPVYLYVCICEYMHLYIYMYTNSNIHIQPSGCK